MKGKAGAAGATTKAHQPAAAGAAAAQAAAVPPGNEVASQAAGAQVEEMGAQQPGTFDRKAFIAAVQKAIDAAAPKNLEEADDFKGSGKAAQVKNEVGGLVKGGKKDAEKDIKGATDAPPDTSKATPKPVTPLAPEDAGAATSSVGAAGAMPGPRPPEETDLSAGPAEVDQEMEREGVTEEQLANANEPDFTAALDARQTAKEHSASAPEQYRAQEQDVLAKGREDAEQVEGTQLAGMQGSKVAALAKVAGAKAETKSQDEAKRAKVAADIQTIYDKTKTEVTGILTGLDGKVDSAFTSGEESARKQFEDYVGAKMDAYKDDRYSGWLGGARWLKDKLFGMPSEVNAFYADGRAGYLTAMDTVIGQVADLVGGELNAARLRIAQGRAEVRDYVAQLPADLQKVGKDAEQKLDDQFDQLSSDVDNKQDALVDQLAQKYVQSRDALDSRIEEMKAANRGLVDKALDAVVGVVKTILKLKDMLLNVLSKAADVIGDIITDPIGFLGNLIGGIKDGLDRFVGNIATHLQNGLMGWLFGALGDAGIKMPKSFDLAGIFELVMDVLGLTYRNIRGRVAKVVGEPIVEKMEQTVDVFRMLVTDGPAALWNWVKDKVGDFQEMVLGGIKEFIIERVIKGGVMWLLSLLNPAAAFIKACKAIYDIVMFIVERGSAIMEFVNSVLDSIGAIARGQIGVAAEKVEGALAKALPLAISFLASLLGLSGITDKIREGIDKVRKPIEKVIDTVVMGAVKGFKKMFGGAVGWVKGKYEKGKQWATDKATAAKEWGAGKVRGIKDRLTGKDQETGAHGGARRGRRRPAPGGAGGAQAHGGQGRKHRFPTGNGRRGPVGAAAPWPSGPPGGPAGERAREGGRARQDEGGRGRHPARDRGGEAPRRRQAHARGAPHAARRRAFEAQQREGAGVDLPGHPGQQAVQAGCRVADEGHHQRRSAGRLQAALQGRRQSGQGRQALRDGLLRPLRPQRGAVDRHGQSWCGGVGDRLGVHEGRPRPVGRDRRDSDARAGPRLPRQPLDRARADQGRRVEDDAAGPRALQGRARGRRRRVVHAQLLRGRVHRAARDVGQPQEVHRGAPGQEVQGRSRHGDLDLQARPGALRGGRARDARHRALRHQRAASVEPEDRRSRHEAEEVSELQFFDSAGAFRFRVHSHEPAWAVLDARPGSVDGSALVARLEDEIRRLRAELPAEPPESYAYEDVDVLGETLRVPARSPRYEPLLRLNALLQAAREPVEAGLGLRAVGPRDLTPAQFRVARVLQDSDEPIPKRALRALLEHVLDGLRRSTTDEHVAAALDRERASWADPATIERLVEELEAAGLAHEDPDGLVTASEELRLLRI